jgi:hypothetical protein
MFKIKQLPAIILLALIIFGVSSGSYVTRQQLHKTNAQELSNSAAPFTIVALPDTQYYASTYPDIVKRQTQWIKDEANNLNIVAATQLGDIVDNAEDLQQWSVVNDAFQTLDGTVAYGIAPGNHDLLVDGSAPQFNSYFPLRRQALSPTWGGSYPEIDQSVKNSFQHFYAGGQEYVLFNLEFCPPDPVLDWTKSVLKALPQAHAIIATHTFLKIGAVRTDKDECLMYKHKGLNGGEEIWQKVINDPAGKNVFLVVNGHDNVTQNGGERRFDTSKNGQRVDQLLSDYQQLGQGGSGFLRLMRFDPSRRKISVTTYSPYLNTYRTDAKNQFVIPMPSGT